MSSTVPLRAGDLTWRRRMTLRRVRKMERRTMAVKTKSTTNTTTMFNTEDHDILHQRLCADLCRNQVVHGSIKSKNVVHRLLSKVASKFEEKDTKIRTSEKKLAQKLTSVVGSVYEGIKVAAKDICEEMEVAISSGPLTATSYGHLVNAERAALNKNLEFGVTTDINISEGKSIRTIIFQSARYHKEVQVPLVMLHGLGGGIPSYHRNFQYLYEDREVYAIDLPGFALSSRVSFVGGARECTDMFVEIIDKWRQMVRLDQFILLGHSFGGYIASAYAAKYPEKVKHLVLLDPWGILPKEEAEMVSDNNLWQQGAIELSHMIKSSPFSILRKTGPLAPLIGDIFISDLMKAAYGESTTSYFIHAVTQESLPTGERAFSTISGYEYIWAKFPMKSELISLDDSIPITFVYGKESPFASEIGKKISEQRKNVFLPDPIPGAGHHVHAECPKEVNEIIKTAFLMSGTR